VPLGGACLAELLGGRDNRGTQGIAFLLDTRGSRYSFLRAAD
jgi:hypothetical protein